jgi:hypothetical protein
MRSVRLARVATRTHLILTLAALAIYAPGVGWGLPHATAPDRTKTVATDEILPLEGLAEMQSTFIRRAPDRNIGYPWFHYFVVSAAQAPYVAKLIMTGDMATPAPAYPFGLRDPVRALQVLTIIGRLVSVVMGVGIVLASFHFGRLLSGDEAGRIAGVLTLVSYPMVYYSRTGNLDVPAFFWTALGFVALAAIVTQGVTTRRCVWLGISAALAIATKDQIVLLFIPLALAVALPRFQRGAPGGYRVRPLVGGPAAALGAYVLATGLLVDPGRHIDHVNALVFHQNRVTGFFEFFPPSPRNWQGHTALASKYVSGLAAMMSLPVLLTAVAGGFVLVRRSPWMAVWLVPILTTFLLARAMGVVVVRYLLPLTLVVDAFAAAAVVALRHTRHARWAVPLAVVLVLGRVLVAADLTYAEVEDTRQPAASWIRAHVSPGARVGYFGDPDVLPALDAQVTTVAIASRQSAGSRDPAAVLQTLTTARPDVLIVIPDWTSGALPHSALCPRPVYAALLTGSAGYRLSAEFETPMLLPSWFRRPPLDYPTVAPPVRIFVRE